MPGTGEGKPPPLVGILQSYGYAPLVLLTAAALVPGTFGNGISLVGANLKTSFHMSNASLGAVAFIAQVSQLLWAVPLALWADRGSRKVVAGVALLIFAGFGALMAISPNVWWFAFLYLAASVGTGVNNTVHNSYLSDAYPTEGRGRIFSWHNLSDPLSQTIGILIFGYVVTIAHDWRYGLLVALAGIPLGLRPLHVARAGEGGEREQPHPQGIGHGPALPAGEGAPGPAGLGGDPAAAGPLAVLRAGGRGHPGFRRHGRTVVREPVLHRQVPPRHGVAQRGVRHHRAGRLPRVALGLRVRRPLLPSRPPATAGHRRHLHHGLRGALRALPLRAPALDVRDPAVPGQRVGVAAGHLHLPHPGRHRAARDAHHLLRHVRRLLARLRRLRRFGGARCGVRRHRRPARHHRVAHPDLPGVRRRRAPPRHRLPQRAPGHHPRDRGRDRALHRGQAAPGRRRHPGPADPQPRLLLRHQPGPLRRQRRGRRRGDGGAAGDERGRASPRCCAPSRACPTRTAG